MAQEWFCTRAEVAARLGIGEKRVNVLVRDGMLTAHATPGLCARLFRESEVRSLAAQVDGGARRSSRTTARTQMSLAEAARTIGVTRKTLRDRAINGSVPAVRHANGWTFRAGVVNRIASESSSRRLTRIQLDPALATAVEVGHVPAGVDTGGD